MKETPPRPQRLRRLSDEEIALDPIPAGVEVVTIAERPELLEAAYPLARDEGYPDLALEGSISIPLEEWLHEEATLPEGSFVALADGGCEVVQACELFGAQLHAIGRGVLFDAGNPLGTGNRCDVIALRQQPRQSDLRRCRSGLVGNSVDLIDDAQVALGSSLR